MNNNTNAQRQRRYRKKLKASGMVRYTMLIPKDCLEMIRKIREIDFDPMPTIDEYLVKCLMKGVAFNFNSGNGIKITKIGDSYQVTGLGI